MMFMKKFDLSAKNASETWFALALIFLGILCRVLPHPDNVTPTAALALFAGVTLSPALAYTVPLLVMMAGWILLTLAVCTGAIIYAHAHHFTQRRVHMLAESCGAILSILLVVAWLAILVMADRKKSE